MINYIAFLRGINVGGHKKVPMAILRELLNKASFNGVKTYIQTGNIVFQSTESNPKVIEETIKKIIASHFGFLVPVIVKKAEELKYILDTCVFSKDEKIKSYFVLLSKIPETSLIEKANKINFENEVFVIVNNVIYFYSSTGYGRTKFNMKTFETLLKVSATSRNYNTINKVLQLSNSY